MSLASRLPTAAAACAAVCGVSGALQAFSLAAAPHRGVSAGGQPSAGGSFQSALPSEGNAQTALGSNHWTLVIGAAAAAALGATRQHRRSRGPYTTGRRSGPHAGEPSPANQFGFRGDCEKLSNPPAFLDGIDIFIFDCDGVIWRGDSLIDGIPAVLDKLRAAGKRCFFVTNNSTKSRKGYKAKFDSLGLNIPPEEIFSSSFAAAAYLEQTQFKATGKKVYVIGEKGIGEELDLIGVPWFGAEADKDKQPYMGSGGKVEQDPNVGAVVVGFDRNVNYYKIQYAQLCINENPGCQFIATNTDRVTHLTDAQEWAGNGSMVGAMQGCTGRKPTVVGKPSPLMIDYLEKKYAIPSRKRICMVGDRLDTDILFGRNNGLQTCLTLSGVTTEERLLSPDNSIVPDVYVPDITAFFGPAQPQSQGQAQPQGQAYPQGKKLNFIPFF